jgi:hypothetical protein
MGQCVCVCMFVNMNDVLRVCVESRGCPWVSVCVCMGMCGMLVHMSDVLWSEGVVYASVCMCMRVCVCVWNQGQAKHDWWQINSTYIHTYICTENTLVPLAM